MGASMARHQSHEPQPSARTTANTAPPTRRRTPQEQVLQLQRTAGNRAVTELLHVAARLPPSRVAQRPGGEPLDPDTRARMEAGLGYDFSRVRVHRDQEAAQSAGYVNATAVTVGNDIMLGAGAPSLEIQEGQRLLAHELAHVIQQHTEVGTVGRPAAMPAAEREADASAAAVTRGERYAVQIRTGVTAARNGPDSPPSPLVLPAEGVDMPWVGKGGLESSELGYERNAQYFWSQFQARYGDRLSPANRTRIQAGQAPVVDATWISFYPQHSAYRGDTLEHHHVGQGSRAVPLPERLHDAYTVFHPQRRVVGTPAGGTKPLPPQPTRQRTEAEIRRHVQQGRIPGQGPSNAPPPTPEVPVSSEVAALPGTPSPAKATGTTSASATPEASTAAGQTPKPTAAKPTVEKPTAAKPTVEKPTAAKPTGTTASVDVPGPRTGGGRGGSKTTALTGPAATGAAGAMLAQSMKQLTKLSEQNPGDKDLAAAVDMLNKGMDAKSFVDNPAGFVAGKVKAELIQGVFNHFSTKLNTARQSFEEKFPDVGTLHKDPLNTGVRLEDYEKNYKKALAALRVPDARKALVYVAVLIDLGENAPAEEVERRIGLANRELAKLPGLREYVGKYSDARDRYAFALAAVTNQLNIRGDELAKQPAGLADDLRRRGKALNDAARALYDVHRQLWESGLVAWVPVLALALDLETLEQGFAGLSGQFYEFADVVGRRKGEYKRELSRVEAEANRVAAQAVRPF